MNFNYISYTLSDIFGKNSTKGTGAHILSTQGLEVLVRFKQFQVRRWHTLNALFTQSFTPLQSLLLDLHSESKRIRWNLKWRYMAHFHTITQKYEKNILYRIWLKSVKQIPRYRFSPKSGRCPAHYRILNTVPIKSSHTIQEIKFNVSGVFSA